MLKVLTSLYRWIVWPVSMAVGVTALPFSRSARGLWRSWLGFATDLEKLKLKHKRAGAGRRLWIHSASIGEFESIRWIVHHILKKTKISIVLTYASPSVSDYIYHQAELLNHSRFAAVFFPLDHPARLKAVRDVFKPTDFMLLQYDFWPHLLDLVFTSPGLKSSVLLNYAPPNGSALMARIRNIYLSRAIRRFSFVHYCEENFGADVKALEAAQQSPQGPRYFPHSRWGNVEVSKSATRTQSKMTRLVAGNVHMSDLKFLEFLLDWRAPRDYQVIWVPHEVTNRNLTRMGAALEKLASRYSMDVRHAETADGVVADNAPGLVFVTAFGFLSTLYMNATLAYCGGGFNPKGIHNVIEPLSFSCPVITGPRYGRQKIALWARAQGFIHAGSYRSQAYHPIFADWIDNEAGRGDAVSARIFDTCAAMRARALKIRRVLPFMS